MGMRYIVYGAGAIGGLTGALLSEAGHEVVLIARGAHAEAIARRGLTIESAEGSRVVEVAVVTDPEKARIGAGDVVLLGMKSQDTAAGLDALRRVAPLETPVACLQNGVANERAALRVFAHVYGVCVMCPATHLEPGVVQQNSVPVPGLLDIGRYPAGTDGTVTLISTGFRAAGFESLERTDVMRWKYRKLLMNLANAAQALLQSSQPGEIAMRARAEGEECLRAASIDFASELEDRDRRADLLQVKQIPERDYRGGSSWQSLERGTGSIESDFLNGEITLLGRLHGVPTPVNELLQRLAWEAAARGDRPGGLSAEDLEARLSLPAN
jgi:2-dehydropantoate 2-reductase